MSSLDDAINRLNKPIKQVEVYSSKTPTLRCIITSRSRITTRQYLVGKAKRLGGKGTMEERIKVVQNNYICRPALKLLREGCSVAEVRLKLEGTGKLVSEDKEHLNFLLNINGSKPIE